MKTRLSKKLIKWRKRHQQVVMIEKKEADNQRLARHDDTEIEIDMEIRKMNKSRSDDPNV